MMNSVRASQEGLRIVDQARRRKRWNKTAEVWCSHAFTSRATLSRFWAGQSIRTEVFTAICEAVGVNWQDVVELEQSDYDSPAATSVKVRIKISNSSTDQESNSGSQIGMGHDWGEAPETNIFYGRTQELADLQQWIIQDNCRLVAVLGMGGVGKTALATRFAQLHQEQFERVIWRSLHSMPKPDDLLVDLIHVLGRDAIAVPATLEGKLSQVLKYLQNHHCLLILDGLEFILADHSSRSSYVNGYKGYEQLLRCLGTTHHRSCVVVTSREMPRGLSSLEGALLPVRYLQLGGVSPLEGKQIAQTKGLLIGSEFEWVEWVDRYAGNPLILKIIASTIRDVFAGSITAFLQVVKQNSFLPHQAQELLESQVNRLSSIERDLLYWLAINQTSITLDELQEGLNYSVSMSELMQAIATLRHCSLLELVSQSPEIQTTQQSAILRYKANPLLQYISWNVNQWQNDMNISWCYSSN